MEVISAYVIPVLTIALTYILGRLQSTTIDKRTAYKEAYEMFYLPFIRLLYETNIWDIGFARLPQQSRVKLFRLILDNIHYMDQGILDFVDILYNEFAIVLFNETAGTSDGTSQTNLDALFDDLVAKVLIRSTMLSKKLRQPALGKFVLQRYLEAQSTREKR